MIPELVLMALGGLLAIADRRYSLTVRHRADARAVRAAAD